VRVLRSLPHEGSAFTQGLLWHDGHLYESVGQYGESELRVLDGRSGRVVRRTSLEATEFGEGIALVGDRLFQLTFREQIVRLWRRDDLASAGSMRYAGEGWGLTFDGRRLVQSDGTATLTFRSADDFSVLSSLRVRRAGRPEHYLNELEWADGAVLANVWLSDEIVRIDPESGEVVAVYDASGLLDVATRARVGVLNGIAWDAEHGTFYLTGKYWPLMFEVELVDPDD
jgi:glutamine cyclotransferase